MSRYFFDLFDGNETMRDEVGLNLRDVCAARELAQTMALSHIEPTGSRSTPYDARELRVRSGAGNYIAKVAFRYIED